MPIDTVEDLRDHLQLAIKVELTTIPPYLYALYSIDDPATTSAKYIRSVVTEEMLHAVLMANILLGKQCGVCHGKVAFPVGECRKCHSRKKPKTTTAK